MTRRVRIALTVGLLAIGLLGAKFVRSEAQQQACNNTTCFLGQSQCSYLKNWECELQPWGCNGITWCDDT